MFQFGDVYAVQVSNLVFCCCRIVIMTQSQHKNHTLHTKKDSRMDWCLGLVSDVTKDQVHIHFLSWVCKRNY